MRESQLPPAGCILTGLFIKVGEIMARKSKKSKLNLNKIKSGFKRIPIKKAFNKRIIKVVCIVIVLLIILSVASYRIAHFSPLGLGRGLNTLFTRIFGTESFPYPLPSEEIDNIRMSDSDMFILYDTGVKVIDPTADEISDLQHNYSAPLLFVSDGKALVIDCGDRKFKVQTSTKLLYEAEYDFDLLTGDIASNGSVAIASKSDKGSSMLCVYNNKQKNLFTWVCSKQEIVSADISDNGRYVLAGVIGAESGDVRSDVYLFDIKKGETLQSVELPGSAVVGAEILNGKSFVVFCDNCVKFIDEDGKTTDIDVSLNTVSRFCVSQNNYTALLLSRYSSAYSSILNVYNKSGKLLAEIDIDYPVSSISCDGKHIAVLSDSVLYCYDIYGNKTGEKTIESDAVSCLVSGSDVYVEFSKYIDRYTVRGVSDERGAVNTVTESDKEVIKKQN